MQTLESRIRIGVIKGYAPADAQGNPTTAGIGAPKGSRNGKARLYQVKVGPQLRTAQLVPPAGEDFNPPVGSVVALLDLGGWLGIIGSRDDVEPDPGLDPGEKEVRSTNGNGDIAVRLRMKANGKAYFANAGQNLRTCLDNLAGAIDTFSNATSQSAITTGGASAPSLAAALVALMVAFNTSISNAKTALDALLDSSP